jgi:hypothetical protein
MELLGAAPLSPLLLTKPVVQDDVYSLSCLRGSGCAVLCCPILRGVRCGVQLAPSFVKDTRYSQHADAPHRAEHKRRKSSNDSIQCTVSTPQHSKLVAPVTRSSREQKKTHEYLQHPTHHLLACSLLPVAFFCCVRTIASADCNI